MLKALLSAASAEDSSNQQGQMMAYNDCWQEGSNRGYGNIHVSGGHRYFIAQYGVFGPISHTKMLPEARKSKPVPTTDLVGGQTYNAIRCQRKAQPQSCPADCAQGEVTWSLDGNGMFVVRAGISACGTWLADMCALHTGLCFSCEVVRR